MQKKKKSLDEEEKRMELPRFVFVVFLFVYSVYDVPFATCSKAVLAFHYARLVFSYC